VITKKKRAGGNHGMTICGLIDVPQSHEASAALDRNHGEKK
jgi:hypothetical protein